jgi:hypothetical protein
MSIPGVGGGANQAMQRALMEAAERALADEMAMLDGEDPASATAGSTAGSASGTAAAAGRAVRRRAAGNSAEANAAQLDEAIVVELGDADQPDRLEVAGGWITTAKRGPLETKGAPEPKRFSGGDVKDGPETEGAEGAQTAPRATPGAGEQPGRATTLQPPTLPGAPGEQATPAARTEGASRGPAEEPAAAPGEPAAARPGQEAQRPVTLDRLILVLKKTGIGFRDAYQVMREIHAGEPLPPRAELRARWAAADPAAWEEHARERTQGPGQQPVRAADADLRQTPVDDLIRDRTWHRANATTAANAATANAATEAEAQARASGTPGRPGGTADSAAPESAAERTDRPTLQTIVRQDPMNQAYVAALSTAEFQRLVTVLGRTAPDWFWDLRGHRGLRGLAERPAIAKLNTTRIAGTRLGAWILAVLGMALLWYLGLQTGVWW